MRPAHFIHKLLFACFAVTPLHAQNPPAIDSDLFAPEVEAWMRANLDEDVLLLLNQVDRERVRDLFKDLNKSLANDNVYDLAPLKEAASSLQPLLEQFETTR